MTAKSNVKRLQKGLESLRPRDRVVYALKAMREGDESLMKDLLKATPTASYRMKDRSEIGAVKAARHVSDILDCLFFASLTNLYRATSFLSEVEVEEAHGATMESAHTKLEDAVGRYDQEARCIVAAAHTFAERIGLDLEIAFVTSFALSDPDFKRFSINLDHAKTEAVSEMVEGFVVAWNSEGHHSVIAA
ncbi:MAG: hypothetical protein RJS97_02455 [Parvibaculaceae bacterium]